MEIKALTFNDELWKKMADYAQDCSWKAGPELSKRMKDRVFTEWERIFAAIIDENIAGYCALTKTDCIPNVTYTPYVSYVFVGEQNRGHRISEKLCLFAIEYAKSIGFDKVYLVSDHINLYEKYGFVKVDEKQAPWGAMETIYMRET